MKTLASLMLTSILLASACSSPPQDKVAARTDVTAPSTPFVHRYRCESGETIVTTYPSTDPAWVQYQGRHYNMQYTVPASGARYVGGGLEWWTKGSCPGSEGTLFRHMADGIAGESIDHSVAF